jgi:hypothetical protein
MAYKKKQCLAIGIKITSKNVSNISKIPPTVPK